MTAFVLALLLLVPAVEAADSTSPQVRAGMTAVQKEDWSEAWSQFHQALRAVPLPASPDLIFDTALAADKAGGRELQAAALYRMFLAAAPTSPRAPLIRQRIRELEVWTLSWARAVGSHALKSLRSLAAADARLTRDSQYGFIKSAKMAPGLLDGRDETLRQLSLLEVCAALPAGDPRLYDSAQALATEIANTPSRVSTLAEIARMRLDDEGPQAASGTLQAALGAVAGTGASSVGSGLPDTVAAFAGTWVHAGQPEKGRDLARILPSGKERGRVFAALVAAHIERKEWEAAEREGRAAAVEDDVIGSQALASLAVEKVRTTCRVPRAGEAPCWKDASLGVLSTLEAADRIQDAAAKRDLLILALQGQAASGDAAAARMTLSRISRDDRGGRGSAYAAMAQGSAWAGDRLTAKGSAAAAMRLSTEPGPIGRVVVALATIGDLRGAVLAAEKASWGREDMLATLALRLEQAGLNQPARRMRSLRASEAWGKAYSEVATAGWNPWTRHLDTVRKKAGYGESVVDMAWMARGLSCMARTFHLQARTLGEDPRRP